MHESGITNFLSWGQRRIRKTHKYKAELKINIFIKIPIIFKFLMILRQLKKNIKTRGIDPETGLTHKIALKRTVNNHMEKMALVYLSKTKCCVFFILLF